MISPTQAVVSKFGSDSHFQISGTCQTRRCLQSLGAAAGSLEDVSSKIPDVRTVLKTIMALNLSLLTRVHNLLAYVVIRFDVAAKAGAGRC